jgi:hypothetical protein
VPLSRTKVYTAKLKALNVINQALQSENETLRLQLAAAAEASSAQAQTPDKSEVLPGAGQYTEEDVEELKEEFQERMAELTARLKSKELALNSLKEEKAQLQRLLQEAVEGSASSEARYREMEDTIEGLKWVLWKRQGHTGREGGTTEAGAGREGATAEGRKGTLSSCMRVTTDRCTLWLRVAVRPPSGARVSCLPRRTATRRALCASCGPAAARPRWSVTGCRVRWRRWRASCRRCGRGSRRTLRRCGALGL